MDETAVAVRSVRDVGPDTVAVTFETPAGFVAEPGQFVRVLAEFEGEEEGRYYTLSSPDVAETFEVTVGVDPEGTLGPWLADREPGDEVRIEGPFGDDYYEGEDSVVLLAGGPGVGPAIAIAERAHDAGADVTLVYQDDEPVHEDRLAALADTGVTVVVVAADLADAVASVAGRTDGVPFVYGFAGFCEDALDALTATGFDTEAAKVESFGPAP
ncbi:FAD-dependent oxidoreductase [Halobacterium litoreum]|uniref:FAD-dependent oxidoreductase n=1 Tax=Halobacterium litoreum TaxID=2039234 RepID=A0ABD5NGY9_9EURY|nr:FAD-binding oxidoreductase [Halobacterium litoreum]UHH12571.1 FAD-binding oxidoreductase [Halobacterium litoreum]